MVFDTPNDQGHSITMYWTLSANDPYSPAATDTKDVTEYENYRSTYPGFAPPSGLLVTSVVPGTFTFVDSGLLDRKKYYYNVVANDGTNTSNSITTGEVIPSDDIAPMAPTGLVATIITNLPGDTGGRAQLNWFKSPDDGAGANDVLAYDIHRGASPGFTPDGSNLMASAPAGSTFYQDIFPYGTTWYYVVRARDDQPNYTSSNYSGAIYLNDNYVAPPNPGGLRNGNLQWNFLEGQIGEPEAWQQCHQVHRDWHRRHQHTHKAREPRWDILSSIRFKRERWRLAP